MGAIPTLIVGIGGRRMNESGPPSNEKTSLGIFIWVILGLIVLLWGCWVWAKPTGDVGPYDSLNALFSGLAFWGVIYAILLQRSELSLQRKELELTRSEVRGQKEQLVSQNITLKQQRFENTFFSLLDLLNSIIDSMEVKSGTGTALLNYKGREGFTQLVSDFQRDYGGASRTMSHHGAEAICIEAYQRFANYRQTSVGHYFRTLYNIVKFIDRSEVGEKHTYINILRAQLSSSELVLLFYNCLSNYGKDKFKPYIEKFGLLENMPFNYLCEPAHKDLYKESAFRGLSS